MANDKGEVKKMWLQFYDTAELGNPVGEYYAMINPETFTVDFKMETQEGQGQGTTGAQQKFAFKKPEEFTFEFLFDNTGIIDGKPKPEGITEDLKKFQDYAFKMVGNTHEPRHVQVIWGKFEFVGRAVAMSINYKLFNPDGSPIRATVKVTIKKSEDKKKIVALDNKESPDLTHRRIVKQGESLPWLSNKIYGDPKYYIQLAKANRISNFRKLQEGTEIFFPPFEKNQ